MENEQQNTAAAIEAVDEASRRAETAEAGPAVPDHVEAINVHTIYSPPESHIGIPEVRLNVRVKPG